MSNIDKQVIKMYKDNHSTYQIAKKFNTYPNKINRILKSNGVKLRSKSEAQIAALETGVSKHPTEGKTRTLSERVKISSSLASYWEDLSKREHDKRVKQAKDRWNKMSKQERDAFSKKGTAAIRQAAKEGSKLEKIIHRRLSDNGFRAVPHDKLKFPTENLEIDLHLPEERVIIEIDGPSHFLPIWGEDHLQKQMQYDLKKNGKILSKGYVMIRVKAINPLSLDRQEKLVKEIVSCLNSIKKKFPKEEERFIEVEL